MLHEKEIIQLGRRLKWDHKTIDDALRTHGWVLDADRHGAEYLYNELPSISDHLHWLSRQAFDDQYIAQYHLLEGFDKFIHTFGHDLHCLGMAEEYMKRHYAAHWILPSPGQLAEMKQRLRPDRVEDPNLAITTDDYLNLLGDQEVAPFFRRRFEAISYRTLDLGHLRELYYTRSIDDGELFNRYQDIGYTAQDAQALANVEALTRARQRSSQVRGMAPSVCQEAFMYGLLDANGVFQFLSPQGFTADEIQSCLVAGQYRMATLQVRRAIQRGYTSIMREAMTSYEVGTLSQQQALATLQSINIPQGTAASLLATVDMRVNRKLSQVAIGSVRKAFLQGELDVDGATNMLIGAGLDAARVASYVTTWQFTLSPAPKVMPKADVLKMLKAGDIAKADAAKRLQNIGYSATDVALYVKQDLAPKPGK
jgi:hypothetical protein